MFFSGLEVLQASEHVASNKHCSVMITDNQASESGDECSKCYPSPERALRTESTSVRALASNTPLPAAPLRFHLLLFHTFCSQSCFSSALQRRTP